MDSSIEILVNDLRTIIAENKENIWRYNEIKTRIRNFATEHDMLNVVLRNELISELIRFMVQYEGLVEKAFAESISEIGHVRQHPLIIGKEKLSIN